jgi:quinol monooxygenase YgiN
MNNEYNTANAITRVVKLTFNPEYIEQFKQIFKAHQQHIALFEGCISLNGFEDLNEAGVFFTISQWANEESLNNYRYSQFFRTLWTTVKPMFAQKAVAHSMLRL